jgi:hypothetical protein
MEYVLVGGSNYDDGTYDGLWKVDYELGIAKWSSDEVEWLESNGHDVVRYKYDLESYLEEQQCKNIERTDEGIFMFEVEQ